MGRGRRDIKGNRNRQKRKGKEGTSLVVLWLGLQVFTAQVQFLVRELRPHKPQGVTKRRGSGEKTGKEAEMKELLAQNQCSSTFYLFSINKTVCLVLIVA